MSHESARLRAQKNEAKQRFVEPLAKVRDQDVAVKTLDRAIQSSRLASAYLFHGPSGVGKALVARRFAQALNCERAPQSMSPCGDCETCRRIETGVHPDVRTFAPRDEGDRNITIEVIRTDVRPFVQFAPFEAKRAVIIFPEAEVSFPEKHLESANAMLKTLEEPRPNVHFVLLAPRPDLLLATIRSRCQPVRFARLPDATVRELIATRTDSNAQPAQIDLAIRLADGRVDRAVHLLEQGNLAQAVGLAERVLSPADLGSRIELADELAKTDHTDIVFDVMRAVLSSDARSELIPDTAQSASEPALRTMLGIAPRTLPAVSCANIVHRLRDLELELDRNASRATVIEAFLYDIHRSL